jgi:hypothetical protein
MRNGGSLLPLFAHVTVPLYVFTREDGKDRVYVHDTSASEINPDRLARAITALY